MIVIEIFYNSCLLTRAQDYSPLLSRAVGAVCVRGGWQDGHFILKCVQKSWTAPSLCSVVTYPVEKQAGSARVAPAALIAACLCWEQQPSGWPVAQLAEFARRTDYT